jgi:putative transposase
MPSHLVRYDIPGHAHFWTISTFKRLAFFWHDDLKNVAVDGLRILQDRFDICLVGYVIMPDHVHAILYPHARGSDEPWHISKLLHSFKKHVGFHGKAALRKLRRRNGTLWSDPLNAWANGLLGGRSIWTTRGYDFNIDRHDTLLEKLDYCHKNPLSRGLVERAEDWPWSSYRFYELNDPSKIRMDWDGAWPIIW